MILGAEEITLKQYAPHTRDEDTGASIAGAETMVTIVAGVQPMGGKDRQALPEGYRSRDGKRIYTETELSPADQHTGTTGDLLVIDGITYEVVTVTRERMILPHFKALAVRIQEVDPNA